MIEDKITPQLKEKFRREIQKTIKDGKERGFLICTDKKGGLFATTTYEGGDRNVTLTSLRSQCLHKVEGGFHTHPNIRHTMKLLKNDGVKVPPFSTVREIFIRVGLESKIEIGPSHGDLLTTLSRKYEMDEAGAVCIGSDAKPNEINCWSIKNGISKDNITKEDLERVYNEHNSSVVNDEPHEWVRRFFDKEIIKL